jgi:hypothetical protein
MTGRFPARTPVGLFEPLTPAKRDSAFGLTSEYPSIAFLMKSGGYETALIGKWHLGFLSQHSPTKNGFDYFGIHSGAEIIFPIKVPDENLICMKMICWYLMKAICRLFSESCYIAKTYKPFSGNYLLVLIGRGRSDDKPMGRKF